MVKNKTLIKNSRHKLKAMGDGGAWGSGSLCHDMYLKGNWSLDWDLSLEMYLYLGVTYA